ncbi:MAG: hypothetical protein V3S70_04785 [Gammaproteobacteria bacterium]
MYLLTGQCHCGNIHIRYQSPVALEEIIGRACRCTYCTRHGAVYASHPDGVLTCEIADPALVGHYRFATQTAEFLACSRCGVLPLVVSEIDDLSYAVVNLRCMTNLDLEDLRVSGTDFDGEETSSWLDRRRLNWISDVTIINLGA